MMGALAFPQFESRDAERAFREAHDAGKYAIRLPFMIGGALLFWVFGLLDVTFGGDNTAVMLTVRTVGTLLMGCTIVAFLRATALQSRERALVLFGVCAGLSEVWLSVLAPADAAGYYQFGLGVIICVGAAIIAPLFRIMLSWFVVIIAAYLLTLPLSQGDASSLPVYAIYVVLVSLAVLLGSYERERLERLQAISRNGLRVALDQALAANHAKTQFFASVSHELRTPMNAIIGFSDVIRTEMFGPIQPPEYAEYIGYIHSSGTLLRANIDDLLDLTRLEAGKIGWNDEYFSVQATVRSAMATCETDAESASVRLVAGDFGPVIEVFADPVRLKQAVINLIINALKFTESGGSVTVSVRSGPGKTLVISVMDTGCGMSDEALERVRLPFAQAHGDSYSANAKGGLGLGLAIVSRIVECLDGRLDLESEVGLGTVASIVIPAARVAENAEAA